MGQSKAFETNYFSAKKNLFFFVCLLPEKGLQPFEL